MGTVNATTMNVGRLLYKGQLSHREGWQVDRGPTRNKLKGIMSLIATLTPPDTFLFAQRKNKTPI